MRYCLSVVLVLLATSGWIIGGDVPVSNGDRSYRDYVKECADVIIDYGRDRYGQKHSAVLVSILDVETRACPEDPAVLDEPWRVIRRGRRNPAGANLLTDQPLLKTLFLLSEATGDEKYKNAAQAYIDYYLKNLVDEKGLFWWGWHRHYDVYKDKLDGHNGNYHEIHAIHSVAWEKLWEVNPQAVRKEIEAVWEWHVVDKKTGEINRHADGQKGCDFSMSAGSYIYAFTFLFSKTEEKVWLDRAKLLATYYWDRRHQATDLFPERPNAGKDRFDGSSFVTAITGLHCHSLLKSYEISGAELFKDYALAYLKAYAKHGYDEQTGKFWGALRTDGTPVAGARITEGYGMYEPRGHLDLWEPYAAGYQYPIYTAQACIYAYQLTKDEGMLSAAKRFAAWIQETPPSTAETQNTWYQEYTQTAGSQGTYAGKYGRVISFYIHLYVLTEDKRYIRLATNMANEAIEKLYHKGLVRGHPAKPYYEAIDGVGFLLYALLELDQLLLAPAEACARHAIQIGSSGATIAMDNW